MIATATRRRAAASLMALMARPWESYEPCEKFNRAASIPASISRSSIAGESLAGPIVQTIFAFLMDSGEPWKG